MSNTLLTTWHELIENSNPAGLDDILADDAVFHSPVVHTPQRGKQLTKMYLSAAFLVLAGEQFRYVREVVGDCEAVLEFETVVDGIKINGVDIISWNEEGKITEFKVMVRPLKAINMLHQKMQEMLEAG
jgi:hypothetical protein